MVCVQWCMHKHHTRRERKASGVDYAWRIWCKSRVRKQWVLIFPISFPYAFILPPSLDPYYGNLLLSQGKTLKSFMINDYNMVWVPKLQKQWILRSHICTSFVWLTISHPSHCYMYMLLLYMFYKWRNWGPYIYGFCSRPPS